MGAVRVLEGIGTVAMKRVKRARRIGIRVQPFAGVEVTIPWRASYASALEIVERNREWILRQLCAMHVQERRYVAAVNTGKPVTRMHTLEAHPADTAEMYVRVGRGVISVGYPRTLNLESPTVLRALHDGVLSALRVEARKILPDRVRSIAERSGFTFGRLTLKNLCSRWGSCSVTNNINLNIQLLRLPDELIDFVIVHELVHTRVKNHGPRFWALMEKLTDQPRTLERKLRTHRL
jgi:predicted metal-dependent hydrolase